MSALEKPKVIVISGPTASGKTDLAIELASYFDGEIVNADSMQVYRGMDIGTAKPTVEQRKKIPHYLIDIVDPDEEFNAAIYREMALRAIYDISKRDKSCFVVGGTGLYIRALVGGLFYVPPKDPRLRESLKKEAEKKGLKTLYDMLLRCDPEYAKTIHPNDRVRIIRALEVYHLSGKKMSELIKQHGFKESSLRTLKIFLSIPRKELYKRIDKRCDKMIEAGLIEETRRLLMQGYSPKLKSMQSIGYRHMVKYITGEWTLEEALRYMKRDTRRYAKRQITWFKKEPDMIWISPSEKEVIKKKILEFLSDCS